MAKKFLRVFVLCMGLMLLAAVALAGCSSSGNGEGEPSDTSPSGTLAFAEQTLSFTRLGQSAALTLKAGDTEVYGAALSSSNEEVVAVVGSAAIAVGDGNATVTASYEGQTAVCIVTVSTQAAVIIEGAQVRNMEVEGKLRLSATVSLPSVFDTDAGVRWSSNNEDIVTVDKDGNVTAVAEGIAQVTAESNYQITTTTTSTVMGMEITSTEEAIASATVTILVGNEYDPAVHTEIAGTYQGYYDWQGFAEQASESNPCYTQENFKWIRSKIVLQLNEDGTFTQQVLNAQRAAYPADIDESLPESTYEEQVAKYGSTNCYVYNRYDQDGSAEEFASETGKEFADIEGMQSSGMHNFSESGYFMVMDGKLVLFYGKVNGFTGKYESETFEWGDVADSAYLSTAYVPFTNLVAMSENMTQVLARAA